MAWNDFHLKSGGSNVNSGSTSSTSASVTETNGDWGNAAANRFTAASGTPFSGVIAGEWASIYLDGASSAVYVAQITAVNGGGASIDLSTTNIIGTAPATGATGRSCKVGGAWADLAVITSLFTAQTLAFNFRGNVQAGTYANTSTTRNFAAGGSAGTGIALWWRGYKTTPGDMDNTYNGVPGTDIPLISFTSVGATASGISQKFTRIAFTSASANQAISVSGGACELFGCVIENTNAGSGSYAALISGSSVNLTSCKLTATTTATRVVSLSATGFSTVGCTIQGGGNHIHLASNSLNSLSFVKTVFDNPGGDAIAMSSGSACAAIDCTVYSPTGHGISLVSTVGNALVVNCHFEDVNQATKAAIYNGSGTETALIRSIGNSYWNNTANADGLIEDYEIAAAPELKAPALAAPGSGDFSVAESAKGIGFPGKFTGTRVYRSYPDTGAVQRKEPTFYRGRRGT